MPKVSIIIPVYNVENYIEKCLNSVVNQTLEDIEIIVVNDGSTDGSKKKILKYIETYGNKIVYLEKENGGLSSSRNFGLPKATGEYIAFLDSDDYIDLNAYEQMYNIAKENDSDMVECDFIWEYPNKQKKDIGKIYTNQKQMLVTARVVAWNKLIKREILEKTNIKFPEGLRYEDIEFFYKLIPYLNKVSFAKNTFVHYVQRKESIVNTQNIKTKDVFTVFENIFKYYKEKNIYEEYSIELEYSYIRILLCSSLKRMCKIKDKDERKKALRETWENINKNFPEWKKNEVLKKRSLKNIYMRSNNKITYKIYCILLEKLF